MRTHQPNPTKFKHKLRFLLPCRLGRIPGTDKPAIIVTPRPGEMLESADGRTAYRMMEAGNIRRFDRLTDEVLGAKGRGLKAPRRRVVYEEVPA